MNEKPATQSLRILFLEDDPSDRALVERTLRSEGLVFEMACAGTEEDFKAALRREPVDLILADFKLPGYDGLAALAEGRSVQPDVPFIFVSGTIGEQCAVELLKSGATDCVLKDNLKRLGPAVRRAIREAEEQRRRRQAERRLAESESRFRQVAEVIDEVFWLIDSESERVLYVSPAYEKMWGRPLRTLYENPHSWLEAVHPEDRQRVEAALAGKTRERFDEVYRILRPDGSVRWIRDRAFPVRNPAGDTYRLVGTAEDITGLRMLEDTLRQSAKMEAIGQLAGGVAHDFNNLLLIIRGNVDLVMMSPGQLSDMGRDCLKQVIGASERAANLTRQLLAFSRKAVVQMRPLDLNDAIAMLAKMLGRIIGEDIRLHYSFEARSPFIQADPGMIEQVIFNLAVNARDAMLRGGELSIGTANVDFDTAQSRAHPPARAGQFVCLSIADTGVGISPENLPRVFEPFFTTKEAGKGTGLGLATVYSIIQQHGGWIEISSRLNAGTTFRIFLPAIAAPPAGTAARPGDASLRGGSEGILLVEDDLGVRLLTKRILEALGYRVWEAADAVEALRQWQEHAGEVQLLLTDMILPGGTSGHELSERLRKERAALKTLFISGYSPAPAGKDTEIFRKSNARFLQKPYPSWVLLEQVRRCLDEH